MRKPLGVGAAFAAFFMSWVTPWAVHGDEFRPSVGAPDYDWTGFYVGGHAGLSLANNKFYDVFGGADTAKFSASGYLGGGQAGFNWQAAQWVLGAEIEGSLSHLRKGVFGNSCGGFGGGFGFGGFGFGGFGGFGGLGGFGGGFNQFCGFGLGFGQFGARVEALGLLSGRVGYAMDRTLLFGKAGVALADETYVVNIPGVVASTPTDSRFGWIIGGGVEQGLTANTSVKIEYNYIDLGNYRINIAAPSGTTFAFDQSQHIQVVKIGFNYRF